MARAGLRRILANEGASKHLARRDRNISPARLFCVPHSREREGTSTWTKPSWVYSAERPRSRCSAARLRRLRRPTKRPDSRPPAPSPNCWIRFRTRRAFYERTTSGRWPMFPQTKSRWLSPNFPFITTITTTIITTITGITTGIIIGATTITIDRLLAARGGLPNRAPWRVAS
jgi:hypothetical protein